MISKEKVPAYNSFHSIFLKLFPKWLTWTLKYMLQKQTQKLFPDKTANIHRRPTYWGTMDSGNVECCFENRFPVSGMAETFPNNGQNAKPHRLQPIKIIQPTRDRSRLDMLLVPHRNIIWSNGGMDPDDKHFSYLPARHKVSEWNFMFFALHCRCIISITLGKSRLIMYTTFLWIKLYVELSE